MMHWACWSAFAELATKLGEDPIRPGKPALLRRGFVMTDELMLFLACWRVHCCAGGMVGASK